MLHNISDEEWFELQFEPERGARLGIPIPGFPSDDYQVSFTGLSGRKNLEQAFVFYKYAHEAAGIGDLHSPHVLDFGGGWGRIARFWLRDTPPANITVSDTMDLAINLLRETHAPYHVVRNPPYPPMEYGRTYDLIYAYSVFSHLSEKYTNAWIDFLLTQLKPSGRLVFTTRGIAFVQAVSNIKGVSEQFIETQIDATKQYLRQMRATFPDPIDLRSRYESGEFQFIPMTHERLPDDCTGETIIPRIYLEKRYSNSLISFVPDMEFLDQAVVTLRS
jgi:hypothetical protein